jgi:eukaryotic-like serine/threonine-protein kinase
VTLAAGSRLGPYEILSPIGAGGMGEVYKARDTRLDRTVAIKVLPDHLSKNEEVRQRFEREAKTISQLSHPHICALYDVGNQDGVEFLVMEYLEGETLADRLSKGPLPLEQTLRYGIEIADALDKAHRQGIIHRDLKPGNVMLTKSGVKLLDFGLAKVIDPEEPVSSLTSAATAAKDVTRAGAILGTLSYMAPEQLEGKKADLRTDIFALGATLYEMATGKKAFSGTGQASVISAIMTAEPAPISAVQAMTPPALDRVVKTCLAKDPEHRWQSAADVGLELAWIGRGGTEETGRAGPVPGRRLLWVGLAAAGLLAAAVFALLYAFHRPPANAPAVPIRFAIHPPPGTRFAWIRNQNLFAVSPDGRSIAFVARGADGRPSLWARPLAESSAVPLPGTEGAAAPFWSPDSRFVAFFAEGKLKKIDVAGGPPVTLCDVSPGFPKGSWGSRHTILFDQGPLTGMNLVGDGGGTPKTVLKPDPSRQEASIGWPEFLPDGRHFLYIGRAETEKQTYVRLASLDDGRTESLVKNCSRAQYVPTGSADGPGYLLYARDGSLLAQPFDDRRMRLVGDPVPTGLDVWQHTLSGTGSFSASDNGVLASRGIPGPSHPVWLDRAGRETGSVESSGRFDSVNLSFDPRRFLVTKVNPRTGTHEVWVGDVSRSVLTKLDLGDDEYERPVWSPDGTRLALTVASLRHPPVLSLLSLRGGRSPEAILPAGPNHAAEAWSPDGRFLLYAIRSGAQAGLWVANADGERKPRPLLTGVFDPVHAQFSPDGRWIAFCLAESGRSEVYVTAFPEPGERVRVSASGGSRPRWRRDGLEIFYVSRDNEMIATPVRLSSEVQVGAQQRLFRIDPAGWQDYDVTGDGERFLVVVSVPVPDADAITVTVNWLSRITFQAAGHSQRPLDAAGRE